MKAVSGRGILGMLWLRSALTLRYLKVGDFNVKQVSYPTGHQILDDVMVPSLLEGHDYVQHVGMEPFTSNFPLDFSAFSV